MSFLLNMEKLKWLGFEYTKNCIFYNHMLEMITIFILGITA